MNKFDELFENYTSRKVTRVERYPRGMDFSKDFLEQMEKEYTTLSKHVNSRSFHRNFIKAISFCCDDIKDHLSDINDEVEDIEDKVEEIEDAVDSIEDDDIEKEELES